VNLILSAPWN